MANLPVEGLTYIQKKNASNELTCLVLGNIFLVIEDSPEASNTRIAQLKSKPSTMSATLTLAKRISGPTTLIIFYFLLIFCFRLQIT